MRDWLVDTAGFAPDRVHVKDNGVAGPPKPVWLTFWNLFDASNQLLAALTLLASAGVGTAMNT